MGQTFHRVRAPPRSRVAVRESRRWAGHDARGSWHVLIRQSARATAGAGLPSMRPPPRPFRSQCRPRRQGDRPEGVRPPLLSSPPPMSVRTRCRKAMQTALPSPLPGPRRRTGRRRRSVDERASVWAARRSVGDRASASPAVDGFSRRGRRRREGGVTTRAAGRPRSAASRTPYFSSPSSFPIQKQAGDGRRLRKALPLGAVRCGH